MLKIISVKSQINTVVQKAKGCYTSYIVKVSCRHALSDTCATAVSALWHVNRL